MALDYRYYAEIPTLFILKSFFVINKAMQSSFVISFTVVLNVLWIMFMDHVYGSCLQRVMKSFLHTCWPILFTPFVARVDNDYEQEHLFAELP